MTEVSGLDYMGVAGRNEEFDLQGYEFSVQIEGV